MPLTIDLPMPPSMNNMFTAAHGGSKYGRGLSPEYKAWRDVARIVVKRAWIAAGKPQIGKPYVVRIQLNLNHKSDIGNREKAITGFPGDQWVDRITIERSTLVEAARVSVVTL